MLNLKINNISEFKTYYIFNYSLQYLNYDEFKKYMNLKNIITEIPDNYISIIKTNDEITVNYKDFYILYNILNDKGNYFEFYISSKNPEIKNNLIHFINFKQIEYLNDDYIILKNNDDCINLNENLELYSERKTVTKIKKEFINNNMILKSFYFYKKYDYKNYPYQYIG